jgi:hypothetical protein
LEVVESEPSNQWQCRGCGTKDRSNLSTNTDTSIGCDLCGTVDSEVSLISGNRQKMCATADDKTIVADFPHRAAEEAAGMALGDGDETSNARRQRHLDAAGGTRVPRRSDVAIAQARVDSATVRDSKVRIDGDPKFIRKRTAVLRFVTTVQQLLGPSLDERLKRHIRMEAARVVASGFEHAQCCTGGKCHILIPSRANALVALCTVEKCLERLVCEGTGPSIADIAPDVSRHQLLKSLDEIRQMQTSGAGASQRAQVAAAVGIAINWLPEQVVLPCVSPCSPPSVARSANEPPPLHLPPALHTVASSTGNDNEDVIWVLRNAIHSAWRLANERTDVRQTATAAVQEPAISEWIRVENTLPICVLGVVMLKAAAIKLELESSVDELLSTLCAKNDLSPTTANNVAICVTKMMHAKRKTTLGVFGDGAPIPFASVFLSLTLRVPLARHFLRSEKRKLGKGRWVIRAARRLLDCAYVATVACSKHFKTETPIASINRYIHNIRFKRDLTKRRKRK